MGQVGGALVYYLQRQANSSETLYAFPPGFRMLAGNPILRSNQGTLESQAITFACLDYSNPTPQTGYLPNKNCPDGLRSQVFFPSCWDGVNVDSSDHKSHVAYPSGVDNGDCPSTHPVRLISIFYEVTWSVDDFKDLWWATNGSHPFVFAMGDPTGYGFHGDFLNGWDVNVLQQAVENCTADSGVLEDCSVFTSQNLLNNNTVCSAAKTFKEPVLGQLSSLPGCNPVSIGPASAVSSPPCPDNTSAQSQSSVIPNGYDLVFSNLTAATSGTGFLTVITMDDYIPATCARECSGTLGCVSFCIYVENHSDGSSVNICTLWNSLKSAEDATNSPSGETYFTNSNGYVLSGSLLPPSSSSSALLTTTTTALHAISSNSPTPTSGAPVLNNYSLIFSNLTSALNGGSYQGYYILPSYDASTCAQKCSSTSGCLSFDLYTENHSDGSNYTYCTLWSSVKTEADATNHPTGQLWYTNSDGYVLKLPQNNHSSSTSAASNHPSSTQSTPAVTPSVTPLAVTLTPRGYTLIFSNLTRALSGSSYMGYKSLPFFNSTQCAQECSTSSGCVSFDIYNERHSDGSTIIFCTLWSSVKAIADATNQPSGQLWYTDSYGFTQAT